MAKKVALTGIKPTGTPHIGNYFGAIKPALELTEDYDARYFIADYHALNTIKNAQAMRDQTYLIAATWIACGLNPDDVLIYRQSDVPETFELSTFLMAFTAKGLMNRAHAYKAAGDINREKGIENDAGINMGLYTYPVLMASDILLFNTDTVPVGKDQKQHVEITADIAQSINHCYGEELLRVPEALTRESNATIPGLDGRKMSKSYNNVLPIFLPPKKMRKLVMKIETNSQGMEEAKDPNDSSIFDLYKLFANQSQQDALAERYRAGGMGWGHAKQELFEVMEATFASKREVYDELIKDTAYLDKVLAEGADKARTIASATIGRLRRASGIGHQ